MWGYRTRDVARMLGMSAQQIRSYARAGFVKPRQGPSGEFRFSFQDLVLLRSATGLVSARVPARRVRRALSRLRTQLPDGRSLAAVRVAAEGDRIVVRDGQALWQPESGQALFDFEVADLARKVSPLIERAARPAAGANLDAQGWYEWGCDLDDGAPSQARAAYEQALRIDPEHAGAHLNLGRLLHTSGDLVAAEAHYRSALSADGGATAAFNLGVSLEDQGRTEDALAAYEQAIALEPRRADAHYNAGRLCQKLGRQAEALRYFTACKRLSRT